MELNNDVRDSGHSWLFRIICCTLALTFLMSVLKLVSLVTICDSHSRADMIRLQSLQSRVDFLDSMVRIYEMEYHKYPATLADLWTDLPPGASKAGELMQDGNGNPIQYLYPPKVNVKKPDIWTVDTKTSEVVCNWAK